MTGAEVGAGTEVGTGIGAEGGSAGPAKERKRPMPNGAGAGGSPVYGLGVIGAAVYFFTTAQSRQDYALAIPKSVVWPAILVHRLLAQRAPASS